MRERDARQMMAQDLEVSAIHVRPLGDRARVTYRIVEDGEAGFAATWEYELRLGPDDDPAAETFEARRSRTFRDSRVARGYLEDRFDEPLSYTPRTGLRKEA